MAAELHPHIDGYPDIEYGGTVTLPGIVLGDTLSLSLQLHNHGDANLELGGITADPPAALMGGFSGSIAPDDLSVAIPIDVTPDTAGAFSSDISIESNDPTHPTFTFTLSGVALEPPEDDEVWRALSRRRHWTAQSRRRHWTIKG